MSPDRSKKNVIIADRFSLDALHILKSQPYIETLQAMASDLSLTDLSSAHALIIRSRTIINAELLSRAPQLQVIISCTAGFDHIDLTACQKWGITVMHTPEAHTESAAQMTWALILACARRLNESRVQMKTGNWERNQLIGMELAQKTLGIVGFGRIGKRVAQIGRAFGMDLVVYDPYCEQESELAALGGERVALEECLKTADVLSLHVPLTRETSHMLTRSQFEYINRGCLLVNTSRGPVIREPDLVEALEQNWIGAVGLDVFEKEPLTKDAKLLQHPRCVLTPHIGANTTEAFHKASEQAATLCLRFFIDGTTENTLPPRALWYHSRPPWVE